MTTNAQEQIRNHPVWTVVEKMQTDLQGEPAPEDEVAAAAHQRVVRVVEELVAHHAEEPDLYSVAVLNDLQNSLTQAASHVSQFEENSKQTEAIVGAEAALEGVVAKIALLPPLTPKGKASAAGRAAAKYEAASQDSLRSLRSHAAELEATFTNVKAELEKLETSASTSVEKAIDNAGTQAREDQEEKWRPLLSEVESNLQDSRDHVRLIRDLHAESRSIAAALADKAVARDYRRNARNQAIGGWIWDLMGTVIGLGALGLLAYYLVTHDPQATSGLDFTRVGVSLAAFGLAGLCFGRARTFHREAQVSKRTDLRVSTVKAFIANMDELTQEAVMEGMAERLYMRGDLSPVAEDDDTVGPLSQFRERLTTRRTEVDDPGAADA